MSSTALALMQADPQGDEAMRLLRDAAREVHALYPELRRPGDASPAQAPTPPRGVHLLAWRDGRPVGMAAHRPLDATTTEVRRVYVQPAHRRGGIARSLLSALEDHARAQGFAMLRLQTGARQAAALALYEATGWTPIAPFGAHADDPTSRCYEKAIDTTPGLVFVGARLRGRRWTAADLPALLAVYGDAPAMRWVGDGRALSAAVCRRWLEVTEDNYRLRGYGMFAFDDRASGETVGFGGLVHPGGQPLPELKYALRRSHWGRGLATEAARALLDCAGAVFGLHAVVATVAPEHRASQRVLAKAGMVLQTLRRNDDGTTTQVHAWPPPAAREAG